mmetsp:Transcript_5402/g.7618  ORF Transcript_5402/g.7618 Transcript_5402/m.7618 type:complete len:134 (+) Transcript_5402:87-488(+)|eukprot:CAMPEP_0206477732 /NCGR_PEP_ID=MMETSP0324_2-20121206/35595_1 /ASSEMBLY_ACC=CAM_ASM_000836 /TAXON_ID=2866 /ORGANISM="Crypthecodinium cohnii, Strain Seligo" /LENGTH=133 /DNA_ID=CAMNT_0053953827 /DNA_START=94 /DNA_END=495 /DNA_ORIENTATION=-
MADQKAERRAISMDEVAKHDTEKDCWLCIHDLILKFDDEFMQEHPGGPEVITCLAGKDATQDFEDIAHSDTAREWTNKYIIGYKEGADEDAKIKLIPRNSELAGQRGGAGLGPIIPAILVVIVGIILYFAFMK